MPGEILSTYFRDGRTTAIIHVNEVFAEVVVEAAYDFAGEPTGYFYWIRGGAESHASEQLAILAAMADLSRMSRVQPVAVVQLAMGDTLKTC